MGYIRPSGGFHADEGTLAEAREVPVTKGPATRSQNLELFQLFSQGDHPPRLPKLPIEPAPVKGKPNDFAKLKLNSDVFTSEIAARCWRNSSQWQHSSSPVYSSANSSDEINNATLKKVHLPIFADTPVSKKELQEDQRRDEVEPEGPGAFSADIGKSSSVVQKPAFVEKPETRTTQKQKSVLFDLPEVTELPHTNNDREHAGVHMGSRDYQPRRLPPGRSNRAGDDDNEEGDNVSWASSVVLPPQAVEAPPSGGEVSPTGCEGLLEETDPKAGAILAWNPYDLNCGEQELRVDWGVKAKRFSDQRQCPE